MSRFSLRVLRFSLVLGLGVMFGSWAYADSYSIRAVKYTQRDHFVAGNDYGDYVIDITQDALDNRVSGCGGLQGWTQCFQAHYASSNTDVISATPPLLAVDPAPIAGDLTSCNVPLSFGGGVARLCNNGHMLISGLFGSGDSLLRGIWDDDSAAPTRLSAATVDGGFMTANGNAFFIDGADDTLDVALDLSTVPAPEPGSLSMLGTGALIVVGTLRRKLASRAS